MSRILILSMLILHLQIKCTRCESKSERIERILDLTVEISGDIETIEEALQQYTSTEILDGDNRYQCSRLIDRFVYLCIWNVCCQSLSVLVFSQLTFLIIYAPSDCPLPNFTYLLS